MGGSYYVGSYEGIGQMLRSDFLKAEMARRGAAVLAQCIATAPVYHGDWVDPHRGRYKDSFSMTTTSAGGWKGDRAAAIIENSAPEARWVEFGTGRQRAHHTMLNALMSAAGD